MQELQKALDLFYESGELMENFENNHVYFGIYYYDTGNFGAAGTYLRKGISYGASDEVPYPYLARISYTGEMYDEAIECLQNAIKHKRDYLTYYNLGNCYLRIGAEDKARVNYQAAQKFSAESDLAQHMLQCLDPSVINMEISSM